MEKGGDPTADIQQVLEHNWAADQQTNDPIYAQHILDAYGLLGTWLVERGRDPGPPLARSEEALARCLELDPTNPQCPLKYIQIVLWYAEYAQLIGGDPRPHLAIARERLGGDERLDVAYRINQVEVIDALRRGEDPGPTLARWMAQIDRCKRSPGVDWMCSVHEKYFMQYAPRAARARGVDERAALVHAKQVLGSEDMYDIKAILAEVELRLATLARSPAERDRHIADGLAAAARAHELAPGLPQVPPSRPACTCSPHRPTPTDAASPSASPAPPWPAPPE